MSRPVSSRPAPSRLAESPNRLREHQVLSRRVLSRLALTNPHNIGARCGPQLVSPLNWSEQERARVEAAAIGIPKHRLNQGLRIAVDDPELHRALVI